jgi:DNA-binding NtrC family response regulator
MTIILTVEDDIIVSMALDAILNEAGFTVVSTYNADQAIAVLETRSDVRFVVTDVFMPGTMSGLAMVRIIKDRWPGIGVVVMSEHPFPRHQVPIGVPVVPKPFHRNVLLGALRESQV